MTKIKQIILASAILTMAGCASVEQSYDSFVLSNTFDESFSYQVENQNTLNDNKQLLRSIENDPKTFTLIKKNTSFDSPHYKYYLDYKMLKNKIAEDQFILDQKIKNSTHSKTVVTGLTRDQEIEKQRIEQEKNQHEVQKKQAESLKLQNEKKKLKKEEQKSLITQEEKQAVHVKKEKALLKQKQAEETKQKEEHAKNIKNMEIFYLENKDKFKTELFILEAHCNIEDAYLIKDDIENINAKVQSVTKSNTELFNYITTKHQNKFNYCLKFWEEIH